MIPLFINKKIVLISNEKSDLSKLPFSVIKHFKIGNNCMVNSYYLIDEIKQWIEDNNITDTLFLFSASSLSNLLGYELYKKYDNNQYLDIGSSLGPLLGLEGWKTTRTYLNVYWSNPSNPSPQEIDIGTGIGYSNIEPNSSYTLHFRPFEKRFRYHFCNWKRIERLFN